MLQEFEDILRIQLQNELLRIQFNYYLDSARVRPGDLYYVNDLRLLFSRYKILQELRRVEVIPKVIPLYLTNMREKDRAVQSAVSRAYSSQEPQIDPEEFWTSVEAAYYWAVQNA